MSVEALQGEVPSVKQRFVLLEEKTTGVEKMCKDLGIAFNYMTEDFDELEGVMKNLDNSQRGSNIKLRGLKEGVEGEDLPGYLTGLFSSWIRADQETRVTIVTAFCIGFYKSVV